MRMRTIAIALIATIIAALPVSQAAAQGRFAFIVGNDAYKNVEPLKKAVNDARAVAASLRKLGFQVTLGENLGRRDFNEKFSSFEGAIQPGDTAFIFYSGHGVELDGANYLIPVDAPKVSGQQQSLLKDEAISTDNVIQRLKARGTRTQVIVLDACRENPFRDTTGRSIGTSRGFGGPPKASGGIFTIYSAGIGEVALDRLSDADASPNSVFTRSFLPLLEDPNRSLIAVAKETRAQVKQLAGTIGLTQSPSYYDEVDGDIFLAKGVTTASAPPPVPVLPRTEPERTSEPPRPIPPVASLPPPPPVGAKGITPAPTDSGGFIFVNSDRAYLTRDDLRNLSQYQLRIARNEIYARRGRFFRDPQLAAYFGKFAWYKPYAWDVSLNATEQANVKLISSMER